MNSGSNGAISRGDIPTCNGLDDEWYECGIQPGPATPSVSRIYRGIELLARKSVGTNLWLQASYVYSSLRGNYDGGVNQSAYGQSWPGVNSDFDYPQMSHNGYGALALDRPHRFRFDGYWVSPWRLSVGLQAFAESGAPLNRLGYLNAFTGDGHLPRSARAVRAIADAVGDQSHTLLPDRDRTRDGDPSRRTSSTPSTSRSRLSQRGVVRQTAGRLPGDDLRPQSGADQPGVRKSPGSLGPPCLSRSREDLVLI